MGTASPGPEKRQKGGTGNEDRKENEQPYEGLYQVLGGSLLLGHRDLPHRLVYGRAGDRTQPEQHQENNISTRAGSAHVASSSDECAPACKFNPVSPKGASRFLPDTSRQEAGAEAKSVGKERAESSEGRSCGRSNPSGCVCMCALIAQGGRFTWWPEPHSPRSRPASRTR